MGVDYNLPNQIYYSTQDDKGEAHEEDSVSLKSNVKDETHPIYSSKGLINNINRAISWANSDEKELSGEVKEQVFVDVSSACRKKGVPSDLVLMLMNWDEDITSKNDGKDANSMCSKILGYVNDLRSTLSRDPTYGEIFASHVLGSASKVKQMIDDAEQKPDDECKAIGVKKSDIVTKKLRNKKPVKRTNRELYDFFYKRLGLSGKLIFTDYMGKEQ